VASTVNTDSQTERLWSDKDCHFFDNGKGLKNN
jgi:hypothetical protein